MVAVNTLTVNETRFVYSTQGVDDVRSKADALAKAQTGVAKSSDAAASSNAGVEKTARGTAEAYGRAGAAAAEAAQKQAVLERAQRQIQASMVQAAAGVDAYDRSLAGMADAQTRVAQATAQASAQTVKAANENAAAVEKSNSIYGEAIKLALSHPVLTAQGAALAARSLSGLAATASTSLGTASAATAKFANENVEAGSKAQAASVLAAQALGLASQAAASASTKFTGFSGEAERAVVALTPFGGTLAAVSRGLTALGGAAPLIGAVALGFAAFVAVPAVLGKAYDDLAKLVDLGQQAQRLDVGATFLKSFTELGPAIRASSDEMQAALQRASSFVQDRLGQQNSLSKALTELQAGGYTGGSPLQSTQALENAKTTEARIRVALAAMAELEQRGQRLALLDLSDKVLGPAFTERLRTGQATVNQIIADIDKAGGKQLFTDLDATRAVALSRAIEDTKRGIGEAMASTFNFSKAAMTLDGYWLSILKTVLAVAEAGNKAVDAVTASKPTDFERLRSQIDAKQQELSRLTASNAAAGFEGDDVKTGATREELARLQAQYEALTRAQRDVIDSKIDKAVGDAGPPARVVSDELARLTSEAASATSTIPGVAGALQGLGGAAASAAAQIASVAAGIRAIQGLNPDMSGVLGFVDKVKQVNDTFAQTKTKILGDFDASGNGEEAAKRLNELLSERSKTLKAITDQQAKGANDYVRSGELAQMGDLDRSIAQLGDNYSRVRKERETFYDALAKQAATPEDAASIRKQGEAEIAKLDTARKSLEAKTRTDAAARAAKSAGSAEKTAGADAYDNAIQRTKDQIQEFNLQASAADKASEEVYKLMEANRLRRAAASAGRADEAGIAEAIDAQAAAYARARKASEDAVEAQRRIQEGQREMAQDFGQFADDILLGGTKISDAFASLAKTFSSSALKALLTGQGGLAGLFGTAGEKSGDLGGLLGGKISFGSLFGGGDSNAAGSPLAGAQGPSLPSSSLFGGLFDGDKITKALNGGAESGIGNALSNALKPKGSGGILSSPLGGAIATVGAGAAIGYTSQSPLIGAAGGALAGLASGNPVMALAGGAAGLLGGIFGESQAKKQAKKQLQQELQARREAYDQAKPQIEALDKTFLGESIGAVGAKITDAESQLKQAAKAASDAGDSARANQLVADFQKYVARMVATFADGFNGVRAEVEAGFGTNGPFSVALGAVQTLGESLKAFVADAGRLSDPNLANLARASAVQGALSSLNPAPTLSATQTELARINGTAAGLTQVLKDLGLSADQAAAAIKEGTNKALDALKDKFTDDLGRKINDAQNKGYLNDASDLLKEVASLQQDASAIGGDLGQVDTYFTAAAQKIVDGSELAGGAFDELIAKFPELAGKVHEYSETASMSADQAAKAAADALAQIQDRKRAYEDRAVAVNFGDDSLRSKLLTFDRSAEWEQWQEMAKGGQALDELISAQLLERNKLIADYNAAVKERKLNFQDRTFAATNDTSTLAGQLSAYDRQAQREREDEVKAGGEALAQLEQAQYAERLKIITDFQKQATEAAKQQLAAAQSAFETFVKNIKTYLDNLRAGASSPLSPKDRLAAAQSQYDAQLALAKGGDRTALDSITQYSDTLLEASKAYNASGEAYQATFQKIVADLQALPTQVSAEQFIVDAIKSSGDAIVSATDAMHAALLAGVQANSPPLIATALLQNFQMLDTSVNGLLDQGEFLAGLGPLATAEEQRQAKLIFNAIDTNGDGQLSKLELQNASSQRVEQYTAATNSNVDTGNSISNAQKATMDTQASLLNSINNLTNSQLATQQQLVNLNASINGQNAFIQANTGYTNSYLAAQGDYYGNTYNVQSLMLNNLRSANTKAGAYVYATGGWVNGPGTGTSDSIAARLSNGEFVVNAASARLNGPLLEALNDNRSIGMPAVAMPMPVAVSGGRNDGALIAEVRALRAELAGVKAAVKENTDVAEAGHMGTMGAVRSNTAAVQDGNAVASRQTLAKKVA